MVHALLLATRTLFNQRAIAIPAVVTLALGIGATTAIFSVAYGVLARPLPYPDSDRLVQLSEVVPGATPALAGAIWISNLTIHAWEPHRRTIGPIVHFSAGSATVGLDTPRRIVRGTVGAAFFDVLGVRPIVGRFFAPQEGEPGAAPVVVISHELWRESFGGSADVVTRTLVIDETSHHIIGVAPPGIGPPTPDARLWTPSRLSPATTGDGDTRVEATRAIARLSGSASPAQAAAEGTALARPISRPLPFEMLFGKGQPVEVQVRTLVDQMTVRIRPALLVLLAGVGLLLLITCANVANLFLSRGVLRERDLAVRVALGASRRRLIGETVAETGVVSALGGLVGIAIAWLLIRGLPAAAPQDFPRLDDVRLDWLAVLFAVAAALGSGLIAGLVPALRGARPDLLIALREGVGASSSRRVGLLRRVLLVAESSLAIVLLIGAILLGRSFVNLLGTDPGYETHNVLTARIYLPGASRGQAQSDAFVAELLSRVRALPGVLAAGASNMAPLSRSTSMSAFTLALPGRETVTARAISYVVTTGYAEALQLQLRAGRLLEERDFSSGTQAIVVNEQFVSTFLAGVNPIGVRFPGIMTGEKRQGEVVGVVGNVLKDSLDQEPQAEVYVPVAHGASIRSQINLVLRTSDNPARHADSLRHTVSDLRQDAAVDAVDPLASQVADSVAQPRFAAAVLLSFAGVALLLAAVGLYGALSYSVARRQREIGVRSALGATRQRIVALIVRDGMIVAAVGLVIGVFVATALTRLMAAMLVGIEPLDSASFALASAVLLLVALLACAGPAWRAAAIDPSTALRRE